MCGAIVSRGIGQYDLVFHMIARSIPEFKSALAAIQKAYRSIIEGMEYSLLENYVMWRGKFLFPEKTPIEKIISFSPPAKSFPLGKIEKAMLMNFGEYPQESLVNLGKKVGISPELARLKVNKLLKSGLILFCDLIPNYEICRVVPFYLFLKIKDLAGVKNRLLEWCRSHPAVDALHFYKGRLNILITLKVGSPEEVVDFMKQFKRGFGVSMEEYSLLQLYDLKKATFMPECVAIQRSANTRNSPKGLNSSTV